MTETRGIVRYKHDKASAETELRVLMGADGNLGIEDRAHTPDSGAYKGQLCFHRGANSLRGIHNQLIERVNTQIGGWCETVTANGEILYRHPDKK